MSDDGERILCRASRTTLDGSVSVLVVVPAAERPSSAALARLTHEYELKDDLDGAWAARPLEIVREGGRAALILEDTGGEPLRLESAAPMDVGRFLNLAVDIAVALGQLHERGLVHKDIKPANVLTNCSDNNVRLTGFGIASRLPRERQEPAPPELVAGTLAYMAPEQTGRISRSIDSRSDLYSLGILLYQAISGSLPYAAADPLELIHCHIARVPLSPRERLRSIPAPISEIIMKLLAKTGEERYQTAVGLERDLRLCLSEWERFGHISPFALAQYDAADRLRIPEKLYGRTREIETLLAAFHRVVLEGGPELVLVSGYSGIGKSSIVNELRRTVVSHNGLFAAGKFDQYKRDIPYATLAQALRGLISQLLGKSDTELAPWLEMLREALGANAQLMISLIPEIETLIGLQPPVAELPPQDAQRRFQLVFRRLLGVFARPEHPLALFLDDLQWLDAATLDLLEHLATQTELRHLMLVGAYRDNEVTLAHPLMRRLAGLRNVGGRLEEITLAPLRLEDVSRLMADALQCAPSRANPLARLVYNKTGGNPFFSIQFLTVLAEQGLLAFDREERRWTWDLEEIHAKGYTDNVLDLMMGKLLSLPAEAREAIQYLACLGNSAKITTLELALRGDEYELHAALWPAVRIGLVLRHGGTYQFLHDRVQEAAYALVPPELRGAKHLHIGRLLLARTSPEKQAESIFEIANHLNRGIALISSVEEREQVADINLLAGQRAKHSTAYGSALTYFMAGLALLPEDCWTRCSELTFALEFHRAECEFLTGALAEADARLSMLSLRAGRITDQAAVTQLRLELFLTLGQNGRAIEVCLDYLRQVGIEWSAQPTKEEVKQEYERLWRQIGSRSIEELIDLPPMVDATWRATMDVLSAVVTAALFANESLLSLVVCRMANISLTHGNGDGSCFAYAWLGVILGPHFGDYQAGFRFGQLGLHLVEQRGLRRFEARTFVIFGQRVMPWTRPIRAGRPLVRRALDAANKLGDLTFAALSSENLITNLLATGEPLAEVQHEAEVGFECARQTRFGLLIDRITSHLRFIQTLRGLTPNFGSFNGKDFDEGQFERQLDAPHVAIAASRYWNRKLQARFLAHDYVSAADAAERAERAALTASSLSIMVLESAEYHLYAALARAARCRPAGPDPYTQHQDALAAHAAQLASWATNSPDNFESSAALVGAEIARLEGRELDAERLYERAIRAARTSNFLQNEALSCELAASFYAARGFDINAHAHLQKARHCYLSWGAIGKVQQLEQIYPNLRGERNIAVAAGTIGAAGEYLDLETMIKVSQAVSSEMVPEKLIDTMMRTAMTQAGAERGVLMLIRGASTQIAAEATIGDNTVNVHLRDEVATETPLPQSVLQDVLNDHEGIILDDAAAQYPYSSDPDIKRRRTRSVVCVPLINQGKRVGALYLENSLTPGAFSPGRMAALKFLASQAANALGNLRLYGDLRERDSKMRHFFNADVIGIVIWEIEGCIVEANEVFLRMLGFERLDFASSPVSWMELIPPEWRDRAILALEDIRSDGTVQPFEWEFLHQDGHRVPVLMGAARLEHNEHQVVAFVLDLTERRRAEMKARESERRYQDTHLELAHANRVATIGQLTASIAHEVSQPITAMIGNAEASLRWLDRQPPDLAEARQLLKRIASDGRRVGNIVDRTRDLVKKTPLQMERIEINEAIEEVIEFTRAEAAKNHIALQTQLGENLPFIDANRTQLQQVSLNLIVNAIHALNESGNGKREIIVSTSRNELGHVLVSVKDTGKGIAPGQLGHIFDAFYTTKSDGMGMGLSICRSIVEAHGGRIWAVERSPQGSEFHFTIPCPSIDLEL